MDIKIGVAIGIGLFFFGGIFYWMIGEAKKYRK